MGDFVKSHKCLAGRNSLIYATQFQIELKEKGVSIMKFNQYFGL